MATLGPATASRPAIEELLRAGVDVVRLNFSHGRRSEHEQALKIVRDLSDELNIPVAVMGDLCGPKIRLLEIEGGAVQIAVGDRLSVVREPVLGNARRVATNHPELLDDIEVGHRVLIDDGAVRLRVVARTDDGLDCECSVGGTLSNHKGVNLPDSDLSVPALTEKDKDDAAWAAQAGLEYVALSFVRRGEDVIELRRLLSDSGGDCHIVSKIETKFAINDLDNIIEASDGVLVARGDMGVELDVATVPRLQKDITRRCWRRGKPVIVATQMLQSMVNSATPTRAEVSDVANAILDGADAVMLSAETAIGKYAVQAVHTLERVALETELYDRPRPEPIDVTGGRLGVAAAVARGICAVAEDIDAKAVVIWTESGTLARLLSKHRPDRPVVALTGSEAVQRRLSLYYGVIPLHIDKPEGADALITESDRAVASGEWAANGDLIVVGFGPRSLTSGDTGSIMIHTVGAS